MRFAHSAVTRFLRSKKEKCETPSTRNNAKHQKIRAWWWDTLELTLADKYGRKHIHHPSYPVGCICKTGSKCENPGGRRCLSPQLYFLCRAHYVVRYERPVDQASGLRGHPEGDHVSKLLCKYHVIDPRPTVPWEPASKGHSAMANWAGHSSFELQASSAMPRLENRGAPTSGRRHRGMSREMSSRSVSR